MQASPTNGHQSPATIVEVLKRADKRWAADHADDPAQAAYLAHLATFVEPLLAAGGTGGSPRPDAAAPADTAELDQLRAEIADLAGQRAAHRAEIEAVEAERDAARGDADRVREQLADLTRKTGALRADYQAVAEENRALADQLAAITAERDQLAEQMQRASAHRCAWEWPGPDQRVEPCECGRPYPRYLEEIEEDDEPNEPDGESWEALFNRIRDELHDFAGPADATEPTESADLEEASR